MKVISIVLGILVLVLAGLCFFFYDFNKKKEKELQASYESISRLESKIADVSSNVKEEVARLTATREKMIKEKEKELQACYDSRSELESKITDVSKESQDEVARLAATYDKIVKEMKEEIEQGQIKITQLTDRLSVAMVDKILFPSGEAKITPDGKEILTRIGKILKNTQGKIIRVEGHTDNVRIAPRLQQKFPTNWELSTTRATNVVRFLQDKVGIAGARLLAVGMSEYHPVASNETREGRSQNRRIEIALLPKLIQ